VQGLRRDPDAVAARVERQITPAEIGSWRNGTVEHWANETFSVASVAIYAKLPGQSGTREPVLLPESYARREREVAERQLERASVRLAALLNSFLT